jgi:hypothetical protein
MVFSTKKAIKTYKCNRLLGMVIKYIPQGVCASVVGLYQGDGFLRRRLFGDFDHLVGNGIGKKDDQIRASYKTFQIIRRLGVNFGLTPVFPADVLVLTDHPVVSAYDYYAHE